MQFVAYTRLGVALLPDPYYNITGLWAAWHSLLKPLKWAIWRAMEVILPLQQGSALLLASKWPKQMSSSRSHAPHKAISAQFAKACLAVI